MARLRVSIGGTLSTAGSWSNTYEFLISSAITSQATLQTIVNAIRTALAASTDYKAGMCTDTIATEIKALAYPANTGPSNFVASSGGSNVSGSTTSANPPQIAVVASLRTGGAGRSFRGRLFTPYRSANVLPSGVVQGAGQAAVAAAVIAARTAIVTACASSGVTAVWVVWSPKLGSGTPVSAVLVGNQCDTIRHRNDNRDEVYTSYTPPTSTLVTPSSEDEFDRMVEAGLGTVEARSPSGIFEDVVADLQVASYIP